MPAHVTIDTCSGGMDARGRIEVSFACFLFAMNKSLICHSETMNILALQLRRLAMGLALECTGTAWRKESVR